MPATSAKQERFMQAVAHSPAFAKKVGVPQSVGKEFMKKPKKFAGGGLSEEREFEDPEVRKLYKKYKEANSLPIGGKSAKMGVSFYSPGKKSAEEAYDRLQNMREEEIQARRGEEKRQQDERNKGIRQHMKGGPVKESKAMVGKELAFMKAKGAPKKMIKHEAAEMGAMKKGGKVAKYARGGGIEIKGKTRGKIC